MLALYRSGEASPVEATRAVLARIERFNPSYNAFCLVAATRRWPRRAASEARWLAGAPWAPLDGVPVSIKDLILTKGWPTLRGSAPSTASRPWDVDAPAAARLREAGAVLLGKTTTPEFGCKGETNSPLTGITRNPWNPATTPGGSSGGAAAAVAAGMGPLAVGTDGAGSVRIPAAFCGNFGLKPSFGRVPAYPLSPLGTVAHLGPHTMSVADAALMMNVHEAARRARLDLAAARRRATTATASTTASAACASPSRRRSATPRCDPEVAAAVAAAAQQLDGARRHVEAVDPGFDDPLEITTGLWFAGALDAVERRSTPAQQALTDPDFARRGRARRRAQRARRRSGSTLRRGALGSHMRQFMQRYDLLRDAGGRGAGVRCAAGRPHADDAGSDARLDAVQLPVQPDAAAGLHDPVRPDHDGLPIGLQFVGPMFGDALVLRAARAYESARPIPRPVSMPW